MPPASRPPKSPLAAKPTAESGRDAGTVDERLFVASVEKAMKILETFDKQARSLTMSEIALRTGMGRSATQRFVYTLEQLGYLNRDPATRQYALATKVFRFAHSVLSSNTALDHAYHILSRLGEQTRETVSWVELDGDEIVILGNIPSSHLTSINLPVGMRFPALPSSSGQVLLAYVQPLQAIGIYEQSGADVRARLALKDSKELISLFDRVRRAGFCMTEKNMEQGSLSISAPVLDYSGRAIAAINLSTLKTRFSRETARKTLVPLLLDAAREASAAIGR